MSRYTFPLLLFSIFSLLLIVNVESCHRCSKARAFVSASCKNTRYPKVCEQTLVGYVNSSNIGHQQLAQIALRVSLARARFARTYLTKLADKLEGQGPEYLAIEDCLGQINDSVNQLRQSLMELQKFDDQKGVDYFLWHMSNAETWASTALTDQTCCAEAFESVGHHGKNIGAAVEGKVSDVAQVTSNALALLNRFITRHRFARGIKP